MYIPDPKKSLGTGRHSFWAISIRGVKSILRINHINRQRMLTVAYFILRWSKRMQKSQEIDWMNILGCRTQPFLSAWTSDQSSLLSCSNQIQGILYPDGEGGHLFLFHVYVSLPCSDNILWSDFVQIRCFPQFSCLHCLPPRIQIPERSAMGN